VVETGARSFGGRPAQFFARAVGCRETASSGMPGTVGSTIVGFAVAEADPPGRLVLEGEHHFSRYRLAFGIEPTAGGSLVTATTDAEFPGLRGRLYRTAVIGSGAHAILVRRMLNGIRRRAERAGG
jgi:hypothetical protein